MAITEALWVLIGCIIVATSCRVSAGKLVGWQRRTITMCRRTNLIIRWKVSATFACSRHVFPQAEHAHSPCQNGNLALSLQVIVTWSDAMATNIRKAA